MSVIIPLKRWVDRRLYKWTWWQPTSIIEEEGDHCPRPCLWSSSVYVISIATSIQLGRPLLITRSVN